MNEATINKTHTTDSTTITNINLKTNNNKSDVHQWLNRRFVRFIFALIIAATPVIVNAQTTFTVDIGTGGDDLRVGNIAFLSVGFIDDRGKQFNEEQVLSKGLAGRGISNGNRIIFRNTIRATQITSLRIRHDGSPRSGNPFDTYDNWNLRSLRVSLDSAIIYDSARDSRFSVGEIRFTGSFRSLDIPLRAGAGEADFTITRIISRPNGFQVDIQNIGSGSGRVTQVRCFNSTGETIQPTVRALASGANTSVFITYPFRTAECSVTGVNSIGSPEIVTANNTSRTF